MKPKDFGTSRMHFFVRIYLQSSDRLDLNDIRYVIYELHPTFRQPKQVANNKFNDFEIKIWTWGFFDIKAFIVMRGGKIVELQHYVQYEVGDARVPKKKEKPKKKSKKQD